MKVTPSAPWPGSHIAAVATRAFPDCHGQPAQVPAQHPVAPGHPFPYTHEVLVLWALIGFLLAVGVTGIVGYFVSHSA